MKKLFTMIIICLFFLSSCKSEKLGSDKLSKTDSPEEERIEEIWDERGSSLTFKLPDREAVSLSYDEKQKEVKKLIKLDIADDDRTVNFLLSSSLFDFYDIKSIEGEINRLLQDEKRDLKIHFLQIPSEVVIDKRKEEGNEEITEDNYYRVFPIAKGVLEENPGVDMVSTYTLSFNDFDGWKTDFTFKELLEAGAYEDLTRWIKERGMEDFLPSFELEKAGYKGKVYGLTTGKYNYNAFGYDLNLLEKLGKSEKDLKNGLDIDLLREYKLKYGTPIVLDNPPIFSFMGLEELSKCPAVGIRPDGKFVSMFEQESFLELLNIYTDLKKEGLIEIKRTLPGPGGSFTAPRSLVKWSYIESDREVLIEEKEDDNYKTQRLYKPILDKPLIQPNWGHKYTAVFERSRKKEKALELLEFIFTSDKLADYMASIEHQYIEIPIYNRNLAAGKNKLADNLKFVQNYYDKFLKNYPLFGFDFDEEPVRGEMNEIEKYLDLNYDGTEKDLYARIEGLRSEDPEGDLDKLVKKLKELGLDRIIEEGDRQAEEWKKTRWNIFNWFELFSKKWV